MIDEKENKIFSPHWIVKDVKLGAPDEDGIFHIPASFLNIMWGNDRRFWQWINLGKELSYAAELLQVNWIEITQKFDISSSQLIESQTYEIFYMIKFKVDAFGWHSASIKFKVSINGEKLGRKDILEDYKNKYEKWHEISGGKFTVPAEKVGILEFGMYEIESDWWKGNMVLEGVKLKPKND